MLCHLQSISSGLSQFWRSRRRSSWMYRDQCSITPLCQVLQNMASVIVSVFIRQYNRDITHITSVPCVKLRATLFHYLQTEGNAVCCKYDVCSYETWMLNKPGKSFMQPMKFCLQWLNSHSSTHNCMPGCEGILAVTASWLVCVCVDFV